MPEEAIAPEQKLKVEPVITVDVAVAADDANAIEKTTTTVERINKDELLAQKDAHQVNRDYAQGRVDFFQAEMNKIDAMLGNFK